MFHTKVVEKIIAHILCSIIIFPENHAIYNNVENYVRARQATDDNITRCMRFVCWITKATDTQSKYLILYCFSTATMVTRMRRSVTFIRTLPVLFTVKAPLQLLAASSHLLNIISLPDIVSNTFLQRKTEIRISKMTHSVSAEKNELMLYREVSRVDCESLMQQCINSAAKKSESVLQYAVNTASCYGASYG
jgi:hypothetical protein